MHRKKKLQILKKNAIKDQSNIEIIDDQDKMLEILEQSMKILNFESEEEQSVVQAQSNKDSVE